MPKKENYLLKKTELGSVKPGFHELPQANHIYGKVPTKDKYHAREVINNWQSTTISEVKPTDKNFVAMNRQGVKSGCIDAKQITNFRKNNQIKIKIKQGHKYYGINIPKEQFTYGICNRPSTPIKNIICNSYATQQEILKKQRDAVKNMLDKQSKKKSPRKIEIIKKDIKENNHQINRKKQLQNNNFKLSKFKNIESKIKPIIHKQKMKLIQSKSKQQIQQN